MVFSVSGIFTFPDGTQVAETLPNCAFGDVPQTVGSRGDYVTVKLSGAIGQRFPNNLLGPALVTRPYSLPGGVTATDVYVQPDRDGEPIRLAPEPSWNRVAYVRR